MDLLAQGIVPDFGQKYKASFDRPPQAAGLPRRRRGTGRLSRRIEGTKEGEHDMSTFMANKGNIVRKWYVVDAAGKPLGHTAVIVADLLRGKRKPSYTPHADCGDNVIVINASKATLSGKKLEQKMYRTHSGWVGGLKETKYKDMMEKKPELAMRVAVRGMMPRNVVTKDSLKRLHIYAGDTHEHQAQKPELYTAE